MGTVRWSRRFKWPKTRAHGYRYRGDIKRLSVQALGRLTDAAAANPEWSATGRPEWLAKQRVHIEAAMLVVLGTEGPRVYRCLVAAMLDNDSRVSFTLDVAVDDFDQLPDVPLEGVVYFAHCYLAGFPPLELDPAQTETWRNSIDLSNFTDEDRRLVLKFIGYPSDE